jgi:hypothetical protein
LAGIDRDRNILHLAGILDLQSVQRVRVVAHLADAQVAV